MPKIDKPVIELLKNIQEYFDLNYVNFVYHAIHTLWEDDDDFTLDSSKLEGWFQHNIWSFIIDLAFRINSRINLICGKGMSLTFSDRKNNTSCDTDYGISFNDSRDVDQKKIGKKGDGIFRLKGDRLEFGAIEAKKKWKDRNGRKLIYY
ncbi:unnamed protein product [Rhizophagus irregularis]|nr:unnamed protein product [Rhizophagus irregularis]